MLTAHALLAAGGLPPLAQDLAICLAAAVVFAMLCEQLRLPHALGFIGAGVLVGPASLGFVSGPEDIRVMADLGIVMLLFLLGVELDLGGLARRGRALILAGLLQVPLTVGVALAAWILVGVSIGGPSSFTGALYLAAACAFSSTLLVVKALEERRRMSGVFGSLCVGLLLAQDMWALIILAVQPSESVGGAALTAPIVGTLVIGVFALGPGRRLIEGLVARFHGHPELMGLTAVGWCLTGALVAANLDELTRAMGAPFSLSSGAGMGAFAAGVSIASVPRAREVVHRLVGLRDFFIVFFFVSLGMAIPWPIDPAALTVAAALVGVVVLVRIVVMYPLLRLGGTPPRMARSVTTQMTQVSEFGLVIVYLGHDLGHIGIDVVTVVVLGFVATSALMPVLGLLASRAGAAANLSDSPSMLPSPAPAAEPAVVTGS